jgi:uncharacterized protein YbbK (DUF523 family)
MKYMKYKIVRVCPVMMYGSSTGRAPIHVNIVTSATIVQNNILFIG